MTRFYVIGSINYGMFIVCDSFHVFNPSREYNSQDAMTLKLWLNERFPI